MTKRKGRRNQRGQAVLELTLMFGLLLTLAVGTFDLGRAYSLSESVDGMARSGARVGIDGDISQSSSACTGSNKPINCGPHPEGGQSNTDIGFVVRDQPSAGLPLNWGADSKNGADDHCADLSTGNCGDTAGCSSVSGFWQPGVNACFAVRTAYYQAGQVVGNDAWGTRPTCSPPDPSTSPPNQQCWQIAYSSTHGPPPMNIPAGSQQVLDVRVVIRFTVVTPFVSSFVGNGGVIFLKRDALGMTLY